MLQQTQVATVVPYFKRFLEAFPNVAALARAELQEILRHWQGLGYYRRARDLHRSAQILHEKHSGNVPTDPTLLRTFPGLGRYTTNAILSQAFDLRLPILEANSVRVLCRLFGIRQDPKTGPIQRVLWEKAAQLLPAKNVGKFNQALMELGALLCTPNDPDCEACPLAPHCRARRDNLQKEIPLRAKEAAPVAVQEVALVLRRGKKVLLAQRSAQGRWAHLWEFPRTALGTGETQAKASTRLLAELGLEAVLGDEILTINHAVTRFRITLVGLECHYRRGRFRTDFYTQAQWLDPDQLDRFPVSSPQRRLAKSIVGKCRRA